MMPESEASPGTCLLVGACGSANMLSLPLYLYALRALPDCRIHVVMTATAARILPPETVRLVSDAVFCDGVDNFDPGHVRIARWADQFVVLPATANTLGQAANGLAGNLVTSALLAYDRPAIFFPSMNELMWEKPSVRRNVETLRQDGHHVIDPEPTEGWEVASADFRTMPGLPPPAVVAQLVLAIGLRAGRINEPTGTPS